MAAKIKCPACGAKNPVTNHRCRLCTEVINPNAAAPPPDEPVTPLGIDHFDAGEINRQVRPARERFGSGDSALAARLAAARAGSAPPVAADDLAAGPDAGEPGFTADASFGEPGYTVPVPRTASAPTAAPIAYEDEPFDPDALFRDMG